jgi:hypothetical protein
MPAGKRCVVYAISGGVRVYVRGVRRSSHRERVAAARNLDTSTGDTVMTEPQPVRQPFSMVSAEDLKHLFDLAVDTPLVCSGSFDTDDVNLLRRIATLLGVDPNSITPDEFASQYPHPFKKRPVNPNPWPVSIDTLRWRKETPEEVAARNAKEEADPACQVGSYDRRCGKPADDPIHTSTGDPA